MDATALMARRVWAMSSVTGLSMVSKPLGLRPGPIPTGLRAAPEAGPPRAQTRSAGIPRLRTAPDRKVSAVDSIDGSVKLAGVGA